MGKQAPKQVAKAGLQKLREKAKAAVGNKVTKGIKKDRPQEEATLATGVSLLGENKENKGGLKKATLKKKTRLSAKKRRYLQLLKSQP